MTLRKHMGRGYDHDGVGVRYDAPGVSATVLRNLISVPRSAVSGTLPL